MTWETTCGYGRVCDWRATSVPYAIFVAEHTGDSKPPPEVPVYRNERCYTCRKERVVQLGSDAP